MRESRPTVGVVTGCFDRLHAGHVLLLQTAANYCDHLVIAVNTDEYCSRVKGPDRPIENIGCRVNQLQQVALRLPCKVTIRVLSSDTPEGLLSRVRPDVYVLGSDYRHRALPGRGYCQRVIFVERLPDFSSTALAGNQ